MHNCLNRLIYLRYYLVPEFKKCTAVILKRTAENSGKIHLSTK